jgi:hypothetical protein
MARELDAKVARVLSPTSIAINVGEDQGVDQGDSVIVWRWVDVKDPDTGDILGSVRLQNLRLDVYDVQPRFCLARVETLGFGSIAGLFKPSKVIASSNQVLDQEQVRLAVGDAVTVMIDDSLLAATGDEDEDLPPESASE